jgi:hypothetical protein
MRTEIYLTSLIWLLYVDEYLRHKTGGITVYLFICAPLKEC